MMETNCLCEGTYAFIFIPLDYHRNLKNAFPINAGNRYFQALGRTNN